ncbi:MAG: efflux RND transporter periplasmic adaptor subunit [Proteobacteria bacterium]|nr:efflux RND transporter periplasmic adaptor subunit [Pseudomonadota bacterium]
MKDIPKTNSAKPFALVKRGMGIIIAGILLVVLLTNVWDWRNKGETKKPRNNEVIQVVSAVVTRADVPVRLTANGTVSAQQTVEVRPQLSATIKAVHIKEGQFVRKGDRLFTLDVRTEDANLRKTKAQLAKARADLVSAERNLKRQRELFLQGFISQAALDTVQYQVDGLRAQLGFDQASVQATHVTHSFGEITAPISGRTGAIPVYPGSLVQPNDTVLVSITQIDPININFTLPEHELAALQQALAKGEVYVTVAPDSVGQQVKMGRLIFLDNAVDTASGSIRLKAEFSNPDNLLWPGMFVKVTLAPRILAGVLTVPAQAVQTGPEIKFLYVINEGNKVTSLPVAVSLIQDGFAVIAGEGIAPGMRVVVEGAQNLRSGSVVSEAKMRDSKTKAANTEGMQ